MQLGLAQLRMGASGAEVEASHTVFSGGKGDLSWTNSTSLVEQQGESSSPGERSGMGTRGSSEPWGRIPRSAGLTRGTAVPTPLDNCPVEASHARSRTGLEEVGGQFIEHHSADQHPVMSTAVADDHALASSGPGVE